MLDTTQRPSAASADLLGHQPKCDQCGEPFEPRSKSGGKPQRFCSPECRAAFHTQPQRGQRSPTCSAPSLPAAADQPKPKDEPADTAEDDSAEYRWAVPSQARIECSATNEDEIEIEQISPVHPDENVSIHVTRSSAVRLARCILFATGFKTTLIATLDGGGGYCDVEDGSLPEQFTGG